MFARTLDLFALFCIVVAVNVRSKPSLLRVSQDGNIRLTKDVVYAQGLKCEPKNIDCKPMDLKLDVYEPAPDADMLRDGAFCTGVGLRPAILIVHGGADNSGDKSEGVHVGSAKFWTSRGFVSFVVNYRLEGDFGLYPDFFGVNLKELRFEPEWQSVYPVVRDVKAAIRFVRAFRMKYRVDQDAIVISGGSTGASAALAMGVVFESDYKTELTLAQDPTLETTHMGFSSTVHVVISHWGSSDDADFVQRIDPEKRSRYGVHNAPVIDFRGENDVLFPPSRIVRLATAYKRNRIEYKEVVLEGATHGAWCAQPNRSGPVCAKVVPKNSWCEGKLDDYCSAMDEYAFPWVMQHLGRPQR